MFLIKYLRITKLTKAFGLLSLVRGLSSVAGPPIAGIVLLCLASLVVHLINQNACPVKAKTGSYITVHVLREYSVIPREFMLQLQ